MAVGILGIGGAITMQKAATAQVEAAAPVSITGRIVGGQFLLNPVWEEARDPKSHRYTFRAPSPTVANRAKILTAYLPKELAIVAMSDAASPSTTAFQVHVSGGRTSPTTIVVSPGQGVQFTNDDPFPHKLYSVKGGGGAMLPNALKPTMNTTWTPPAEGVYEIRDQHHPSIRSWIVVSKQVAAVGYPNLKNNFTVKNVPPGAYKLQAFFGGKAVGKPVVVSVRPAPALQPVTTPLVVGTKAK